jgi:pilus assembly protein Flp/PilA
MRAERGEVKSVARFLFLLRRNERGQSMVEYALILVLIAVVVIGTLTIMGGQINNIFHSISNSL